MPSSWRADTLKRHFGADARHELVFTSQSHPSGIFRPEVTCSRNSRRHDIEFRPFFTPNH
jgi:hypothetical protein